MAAERKSSPGQGADLPRRVRKHVRRLERELEAARRKEERRIRKLEKARMRRQTVQAALDEIRGEIDGPTPAPKPPRPASRAATKPRSTGRTASARKPGATTSPAGQPPKAPPPAGPRPKA